MRRGFIVQPTYRIEQGRAVVLLYGVLANEGDDSHQSFLVRDDRRTPNFLVRADDAESVRALGARVHDSDHTTLDGHRAARVEVDLPGNTPNLRDHLHRAGLPTYEADVRFARRYLIDRGLRASIVIDGPSRPGRHERNDRAGVDHIFENPRLLPGEWTPHPRVLSIDIETDMHTDAVLSVALHGCGVSEVLVVDPGTSPTELPGETTVLRDEPSLLRRFARRVRQLDPDLITGWSVVDFDLRVLIERARRYRVRLELGRAPGALRLRTRGGPRGGREALIHGRMVVDGMELMRSSFIRMERWNLDFVAQQVLGEGKTMTGSNRGEAILETWRSDLATFVDYNRTDARLVLDILDEQGLIPLSVERSHLTGLPIERVSGAIAAVDMLYLTELGREKIVAPSVAGGGWSELEIGDHDASGHFEGGYVLEPRPGLYRHVLTFDFKSLYPSLIRTFHIDPLGWVPDGRRGDPDLIAAPNGATFRRHPPGILPRLLDDLMPRRAVAQAAGDKVASHAIKILMNSFYGVLGTSACRFHQPAIAAAITSFGRTILLWTKARIEHHGHRVLYGDTDSLFVLAGTDGDGPTDGEATRALGERLRHDLEHDLARYIAETWDVESKLVLELERLYSRLLLLPMRSGGGGARKRYAGLVGHGDDAEVVFTGMEAVRRDWTPLAKDVQRELYRRLFFDQPVDQYLAEIVAEVRNGVHDHGNTLTYRKALRKPLDAYTATTPPHVAAARKDPDKPSRIVDYVITRAGPEPAAHRANPYDHEHYVQKQIRPVAEPVLAVLGRDFDRVVGDDAQLSLF
ncbi:MAG: DNA polymerase II [Acidobacteriota bacterium]